MQDVLYTRLEGIQQLKTWDLKKRQKYIQDFLIEKKIRILIRVFFILLPAFFLIIWVMSSPKNF